MPKSRDGRVLVDIAAQANLADGMGIADQTLGAYVAVVDRKGNNLGFVQGEYSKVKAAKIINLLRSK